MLILNLRCSCKHLLSLLQGQTGIIANQNTETTGVFHTKMRTITDNKIRYHTTTIYNQLIHFHLFLCWKKRDKKKTDLLQH